MNERARPWSVLIAVDEVPETGRHFDLAADAATCAGVAALAGVGSISDLRASFDVDHDGRRGLRVTGSVRGLVDQVCVVTLEPMRTAIEAPVEVAFAPQSAAEEGEPKRVEVSIDAEGPDPLVDDRVDLGAIATEFLILAIDPYPRKPGVVFEAPALPEDPAEHPFAALAALKRGDGGGRQ